MTGFGPVLRKEFVEFFRTRRVWVVGGAFTLFGLVDRGGRFTNQLLASALGDGTIELPDPTYLDAWAQWSRDLPSCCSSWCWWLLPARSPAR